MKTNLEPPSAVSAAQVPHGAPLLEVRAVRKSFGTHEVLKGVSLSVGTGEFYSLLGASGCGKTTLLRIIAGFEQAGSGSVILAGTDATNAPVQARNLNLVFQNYALFPHMNVFDNVAFGLRMQRAPKMNAREVQGRVEEMLGLVRLTGLESRLPSQLSGGQQQRVALARALAPHPALLLLDEPMGALDANLRQEMQRELRALQRRLGLTFIHVTHDQDEALALSDRIAILHKGELLQVGTPEEVYAAPASRAVAEFFPEANFFSATFTKDRSAHCSELGIEVALEANAFTRSAPVPGSLLTLHARPEKLRLARAVQSELNPAPTLARIAEASYLGREIRYVVALPSGRTVIVAQAGSERFAMGEPVFMGFREGALHALASANTEASQL